MQLFDLSGRTALITGASSGLGANFARVLADAGADVVLAARRVDRLDALAKEINSTGRKALAIAMDVTDAKSVEAGFARIAEEMGTPADIIVNNAGVSHNAFFTEMREEDWDFVMDVNLQSCLACGQGRGECADQGGQAGRDYQYGVSCGFARGANHFSLCDIESRS